MAMGIGVHRVRLDVALVLIERVEDVRAFVAPHGMKWLNGAMYRSETW